MRLKNQLAIGIALVGTTALALGLGLGLGLRQETVVDPRVRADDFTQAINTAQDMMATRLASANPEQASTYQRVPFGPQAPFSYDKAEKAFVLDLGVLFAKASASSDTAFSDSEWLAAGEAFGVITTDYNYASIAEPEYDRLHPIVVPLSEAAQFRQAQPTALESTSDLNASEGATAFFLPALTSRGESIFAYRRDLINPISYTFIDPYTGALKTREPQKSAELVTDIQAGIRFLIAKFARIADATNRKIILRGFYDRALTSAPFAETFNDRLKFIPATVVPGAVATDQTPATEATITSAAQMETIAGSSARGLTTLFTSGTEAILPELTGLVPVDQFLSQSQWEVLDSEERAGYVVFDSSGMAQIPADARYGVPATTYVRPAEHYDWTAYAVKRTYAPRAITNLLNLSQQDAAALAVGLGANFAATLTSALAQHEFDSGPFTSPTALYANWDRTFRSADFYADYSAAGTQAKQLGVSLAELYRRNRVATGYKFNQSIGFWLNLDVTRAKEGATAGNWTFTDILLKAYSVASQWPAESDVFTTVLRKVMLKNLFKSVPDDFARAQTQPWGRIDLTKPLVFATPSIPTPTAPTTSFDTALYINFVRNYPAGGAQPTQKVFAKTELHQQVFGDTSASDTELLTFLLLQASLYDNGYLDGKVTNAEIRVALPLAKTDFQRLFGDVSKEVALVNGFIVIKQNAVKNLSKLLSLATASVVDLNGENERAITSASGGLISFASADVESASAAVAKATGREYQSLNQILALASQN